MFNIKNNDIYELPNNIDKFETIIFPFISKNKYGIISYVNQINISNKERSKCLVYIKHGNNELPSFIRKISKQLMYKLKLNVEPIIHSIHINEFTKQFRYNGNFVLFLIECFIKKINDDISGQSKILNEYITLENMMKSVKRYKEIYNNKQ